MSVVVGLISPTLSPLSLYIVIPEYSALTGSLNVNSNVSGAFDITPFCGGVVFPKLHAQMRYCEVLELIIIKHHYQCQSYFRTSL